MKIGFDAKRLFLNNTGLGNYARTAVKNLQIFYPEHEYYLFTPEIVKNEDTDYFITNESFHIITPNTGFPLWRQFGVIKDLQNLGIQVYHGLSHELPLGPKPRNIKYIVTIHDLIWEIHPEWYSWLDRKIYNLKYKKACHLADDIVAISHSTKSDLVKYWNIPDAKVKTVYQSCNPKMYNDPIQEGARHYFLYVGSIIPRKGLNKILEAYRFFKKSEQPHLKIVGTGKEYLKHCQKTINRYGLQGKITFLGSVSNHELTQIYDQALALLYPSQYEGFGIPILEALLRKVPVITMPNSSLSEAGGPYSFYVEPSTPEEIAKAMKEIMAKEEVVKRRVEQSFQYASETFDPSSLARQLMQIYVEK